MTYELDNDKQTVIRKILRVVEERLDEGEIALLVDTHTYGLTFLKEHLNEILRTSRYDNWDKIHLNILKSIV